jgi:tetratricopeptide (TPR) repeat protein/TolB-like protein
MNVDRWPRVKELFYAALERAPEERDAFVADACGGDAALSAEIERLLAAHRKAGSFIERPPAPIEERMSLAPQRTSLTGRSLGRYEIGPLIGVGGMGEVYAARDVALGRDVALKIGSDSDLEAQTRLRREAQQASQLNHPHICTIHEVAVADGQAYIVMEYVEGQRLSDVIPREGLDVDRLLRYGIQIADGLGHAHQHGISHRDLKSENVMITPDGRAKILDFGLARRLPAGRLKELSDSRTSMTAEPVIAGTLSSMAPELLRGEDADQRSDIWSLGVLLYEMASGVRPFGGATGFELSGAILHEPPPVLPFRVPASLASTIRRCLAKDPRDRYQHAGEVRSALEALEVETSGSAVRSRSPAAVRSRRAAIAALGLAAAALAAVVVTWRISRADGRLPALGASGRPTIAVVQFENVTGDDDIAWMTRGVPNMLLTGLAQTRGLDIVSAQRLHEVIRQTGGQDLESLDRTQVADVATRAGAGAVVVGSIAKSGNDIRIDAQLEDVTSGRVLVADSVRGTDVFALVDQLASRIRSGVGIAEPAAVSRVSDISTSSLDAYRLYSEGFAAYSNTRYVEARELFKQAVAIDPTFAEAYLILVFTSNNLGMFGDRDFYAAKAAEHADRLGERQRILLRVEQARYAGNYGEAVRGLDELMAKYPDVVPTYAIAYVIYQPVIGSVHDPEKFHKFLEAGVTALPKSTYLRNLYGYMLMFEGRFADAVRAFQSYADIAPREPNPQDSLGEAHLLMGLPEKAIEHYSRSLTIDPAFLHSHTGHAWARSMMGQYDEALAHERSFPALRAFVLSRVGRHREAQQLIDGEITDAGGNKNVRDQGVLLLLSAALAIERGQTAFAAEQVRRADQVFAELPQVTGRVYSVLAHAMGGLALVRAGEIEKARARLELQRQIVNRDVAAEYWWHKLLEGEIALAEGNPRTAAAAFSAGEPQRKMWFCMNPAPLALLANNLLSRDGVARAAKMQGDLGGAIQTYRRLLTFGPDQRWTSMYEPRYVFEIAALLERSGDKAAALREYERFLGFWKSADGDLPELAEARRAIARLRATS